MRGGHLLKIRELGIEDFSTHKDTILEMLIDSYTSNFGVSYKTSISIAYEKIDQIPCYLEQNNAILVGAFEKGKLIGIVWLYKHKYFNELRLHINQIIIEKNCRGKGIGTILITEVQKIAKDKGIRTIDLLVSESNLKVVELYNSLGFITERRRMKKEL